MSDGSRKQPKAATLYIAAHDRKREVSGRADMHRCQHCGDWAMDWALVAEPVGELQIARGSGRTPVLRWTDCVEDLVPLCRRCHRRYDNQIAREMLEE